MITQVTVATSSLKSSRSTTRATAIIDEFSGFSDVPRLRPATARPVRGELLTATVFRILPFGDELHVRPRQLRVSNRTEVHNYLVIKFIRVLHGILFAAGYLAKFAVLASAISYYGKPELGLGLILIATAMWVMLGAHLCPGESPI